MAFIRKMRQLLRGVLLALLLLFPVADNAVLAGDVSTPTELNGYLSNWSSGDGTIAFINDISLFTNQAWSVNLGHPNSERVVLDTGTFTLMSSGSAFSFQLSIGANTEFVLSGSFDTPNYSWTVNGDGGGAVVLAPGSSFRASSMDLFTSTAGTFSVDASDFSLVNDLTLSDTTATAAGQGVLNVLNGGSFAARKGVLNAGSVFSVVGPGSGAEFSKEVKLGADSTNAVSTQLQVTDGGRVRIGAGLLVGATGSGYGVATVTGSGSLLEIVADNAEPMPFTDISGNAIEISDGGTLQLLGGETEVDRFGIFMNGSLNVAADGHLELLSSAAATPEIHLNRTDALSQVKIGSGGTFRSEKGKITTNGMTFASGSEYLVHVDHSLNDRLSLDAASLSIENGTMLTPVIADHTYYKLGVAQKYTIIDAKLSATPTGVFSVAQSLVLTGSFLWYLKPPFGDWDGLLTLIRSKSYADAFREAGVHQNGVAVAEVLDRILARAPSPESALLESSFDRLDGIAEIREMYRAGELYRADVHPASYANSFADARLFQRQLWDRLAASEEWAAFPVASDRAVASIADDFRPGSSLNLWAGAYGSRNRLESSAGDLSGKYNQTGFALGHEWRFGAMRLGVAAGYARNRSDYDQGFGRDHADTLNLGIYGRVRDGAFRLDFSAGYTSSWREMRRTVYAGQATAKPRDDIWSAGLRVGYDFCPTPAVRVGPEAGIIASHLRRGAGNERGQGQSLYGWQKENITVAEMPLGVVFESTHRVGTATLRPKLGAHYVARAGRGRYVSNMHFLGIAGSDFKNVSASQRHGRVELSAGIGMRLGERVDMDVAGRASFAGGWREQSVTVRFALGF